MKTVRILPACELDRDALQRLHAESWRSAYAALVPADALDRLDAEMAARWAGLPAGVLCAWEGARLVGFVRLRRRDGWPYIDNLHSAPSVRGRGVGRHLLRAAGAELAGAGAGRVWLTVIAANRGARRFYARHGGAEGAAMVEPVLGHPTVTRPVIWNRLAELCA